MTKCIAWEYSNSSSSGGSGSRGDVSGGVGGGTPSCASFPVSTPGAVPQPVRGGSWWSVEGISLLLSVDLSARSNSNFSGRRLPVPHIFLGAGALGLDAPSIFVS